MHNPYDCEVCRRVEQQRQRDSAEIWNEDAKPGIFESWDDIITLGCNVAVMVSAAFMFYKLWEAYSKGLLTR